MENEQDSAYVKLTTGILKQLIKDFLATKSNRGHIKREILNSPLILNILDFYNFSPEEFISLLNKKLKNMR